MIAACGDIQPGAFLQGDIRPLAVLVQKKRTFAPGSPRSMSGLQVADMAQVQFGQATAQKGAIELLAALPEKWRAREATSGQQAREGQGKGVGKGLELREKTSSDGECPLYSFLSFNMLSERV